MIILGRLVCQKIGGGVSGLDVIRFIDNNTIAIGHASACSENSYGDVVYEMAYSYKAIKGNDNSISSNYASYYKSYSTIYFCEEEWEIRTYVKEDDLIIIDNGNIYNIIDDVLIPSGSTVQYGYTKGN